MRTDASRREYAHAAAGDYDCSIRLGSHFYKYPGGEYLEEKDSVAGRVSAPATELFRITNYRLCYASYSEERYRRTPNVYCCRKRSFAAALANGG